jgi:N6-L-threonylcarbamoyladenine synthase
MILLGIDTSCDDTSIAALRDDQILSNVITSQDDIHRSWGGVVPNLARRAHQENFPRVYKLALKRAGITEEEIDAIAVTKGPGLAISLEVGIENAQQLASRLNKPLFAINHMEGHLLSGLALSKNGVGSHHQNVSFPALGLLVSGGHTEIVLMKAFGEYEVVGQTVDDAIGEAYDKVARMVGLGYPGGALLAKLASKTPTSELRLPTAMKQSGDLNVSYSGLKTAARHALHKLTNGDPASLTKAQTHELARAFQNAAISTVLFKVEKAIALYKPQTFFLGGGVAANTELRTKLRKILRPHSIPLVFPRTKKLCADNGAMIALTAYLAILRGIQPNKADEFDRIPYWPIGISTNA